MTGSRAGLLFRCRRRRLGVEVLQRGQDAVGPRIHSDRRQVAPTNDSLAIDDEKRSGALADPGLVGAIQVRYCALRLEICQERKMQIAVVGKGHVAPGAVDGNTQELSVEAMK